MLPKSPISHAIVQAPRGARSLAYVYSYSRVLYQSRERTTRGKAITEERRLELRKAPWSETGPASTHKA